MPIAMAAAAITLAVAAVAAGVGLWIECDRRRQLAQQRTLVLRASAGRRASDHGALFVPPRDQATTANLTRSA